MREEEFDSSMQLGPSEHGTQSAWKRSYTAALLGSTSDDLQPQLLTPYPEIPSGFAVADLPALQRSTQIILGLGSPRYAWLTSLAPSAPTVFVHTRSFTLWEARCEIVRRAIEYLDKR